MAVLETACPHCHRQSQFKLFDRIAEGPASRKVGQRTNWGYAFQGNRISVARAARRNYELNKADLQKAAFSATEVTDKFRKLTAWQNLEEPAEEPDLAAFSAQCTFADCGGPVLLICYLTQVVSDAFTAGSPAWELAHLPLVRGGAIELAAIFPASTTLDVHPAWPEIAKSHLPELVEDLARNREASRILAGARTVLDVVLKDLIGDSLPKVRSAQIQKLQEMGLITLGIASWAKSLWKDGSDASHDGIGDEQQASAYLDFLKILLQVAYVLPAQITILKAKTSVTEPSA